MVSWILFIDLFLPDFSHLFIPFIRSHIRTGSMVTQGGNVLCWYMAHIFASPIRENISSSASSRDYTSGVKCQYVQNICGSMGPTSVADVLTSESSSIIWSVTLRHKKGWGPMMDMPEITLRIWNLQRYFNPKEMEWIYQQCSNRKEIVNN